MKIYLAGPCDSENRSLMVNIKKCVINNFNSNDEVYCPWELKIENAWDLTQEQWATEVFNKDIEAIYNCDIMIMISCGRKSTAGVNWEQGFAYALGKKIFVLQITDQPTSLMTYCGCTNFYNTQEELESAIKFIAQNWERNNLYKHSCKTVLT